MVFDDMSEVKATDPNFQLGPASKKTLAVKIWLDQARTAFMARVLRAAIEDNTSYDAVDARDEFEMRLMDVTATLHGRMKKHLGLEATMELTDNTEAWHAAIRSGIPKFKKPKNRDLNGWLAEGVQLGRVVEWVKQIINNTHPFFQFDANNRPELPKRLPPEIVLVAKSEPLDVPQVVKNPVSFKILHVDGGAHPMVWIDRVCARAATPERDTEVLFAKDARQAATILKKEKIGLVICHWIGPHRDPESTLLRDLYIDSPSIPIAILPYEPANVSPSRLSQWQEALSRVTLRPRVKVIEMKGGIAPQIIEAIHEGMSNQVKSSLTATPDITPSGTAHQAPLEPGLPQVRPRTMHHRLVG